MPAAGELPGRILIRGLRCRGRQGTTTIEQHQAHDYLVDVSLSVEIAAATACMTMSEATARTLAPGSLMKSSATSGIHESTSAAIARRTNTRLASRKKRRMTA